MKDLSGLPNVMSRGGAALVAAADNIICHELGESQYSAVSLIEGVLSLHYTPKFAAEPEAIRAELLEHEAAHIAMDFFGRGKILMDRKNCKDCSGDKVCELHHGEWQLWNVAHDCAINHHLNPDLLPHCIVPHEYGPGQIPSDCNCGSNFENTKLPIVPAEVAYGILKERQSRLPKSWCSHQFLGGHPVPMSLLPKLIQIVHEVNEAWGKKHIGTSSGNGQLIEVLPFVDRPKWLDELEQLLIARTRMAKRRTWLRDSRRSVYVRGRQRHRAPERTGLVLLDTSGSMWNDLSMLLAQITHYMPLCEGAAWDTVASERGPVSNLYERTAKVGGGGTDPRCASALRREGELVIWVTDCEVVGWPEMGENDIVVRTSGSHAVIPTGVRVIDV